MYSGTKQLGGSDHICLKAAMFENPSHQIICSTGIEQAAMNVRQMDKAQAPFRDGDKLDRASSTFENLTPENLLTGASHPEFRQAGKAQSATADIPANRQAPMCKIRPELCSKDTSADN
jgi:hypothetical protein